MRTDKSLNPTKQYTRGGLQMSVLFLELQSCLPNLFRSCLWGKDQNIRARRVSEGEILSAKPFLLCEEYSQLLCIYSASWRPETRVYSNLCTDDLRWLLRGLSSEHSFDIPKHRLGSQSPTLFWCYTTEESFNNALRKSEYRCISSLCGRGWPVIILGNSRLSSYATSLSFGPKRW